MQPLPGDSDFLFSILIMVSSDQYLNKPFSKSCRQLSGSTMLRCKVRQPGKCTGAHPKGWSGFHSDTHSLSWRILSSLLPTQTFQNELVFITIGACSLSSKEKRHTHLGKKTQNKQRHLTAARMLHCISWSSVLLKFHILFSILLCSLALSIIFGKQVFSDRKQTDGNSLFLKLAMTGL